MTPEQLITFSHVAEHENISRAARALHLSQPAVSAQLHGLQQSFGEPLYVRRGRGIALTPAGERLKGPAARVRAGLEQAIEQRQAARTLQTGHLRIGASTTPASYLLPQVVAAFRREYPGVSLQMSAGNTQEILGRLAELDIAVVEGEIDPTSLSTHQTVSWQEDEVVAVCRTDHPLATREAVDIEELATHTLVMREQGSGVRHMVVTALETAGLTVGRYLELAGVEGIKQGVRAGLGIGFVSRLSLHHEDGSLHGLRIGNGLVRTIRIIAPEPDRLPRCASAFLSRMKTTR